MPKSRRGHGEGTIYKREDGYWICQIDLGKDENGKRIRKTISAKSEREAVRKKTEFLHKRNRGELPKNDRTTLGGWLTYWLEKYKKLNLKQTTYDNYENLINTHILPHNISNTSIQKLTTDQVQAFLTTKTAEKKIISTKEITDEDGNKKRIVEKHPTETISVRVIILLHFLIRSSLKQAVINNIIVKNVADYCELPKVKKTEIKPLSREQQSQLLISTKKHRLYAAIALDLYTGLRRGELLALKWENVDLTEGSIRVVENLVRIKSSFQFQDPKTQSSLRTIPLPEKVKDVLIRHKDLQDKEKEKAEKKHKEKGTEKYQDNNLVFCTKIGKPLNPRSFQRTAKTLFKKAGLPEETRVHDLRHTFITEMVNQGTDIKTAQGFSGHTDTRMLLDNYAHLIEESKLRAAQTMNSSIPDDL